MLNSLYIKNYAIISELKVEFRNGLTTVTGETGAGKSILLGALSLISGNRADTDVLKDKESKCIVEATFTIREYNLANFFHKHDLDYENETTIRREISSSGKSRAFINDTPVILNILKELGAHLIDIHSQNEALILKDKEFQINALDILAGTTNLVQDFNQMFQLYHSKEKELKDLEKEINTLQDKTDYLEFQFNELEEAQLRPGELKELEEEYTILSNVEEISMALAIANRNLKENEINVASQLNEVLQSLEKIKDFSPSVSEICNRIESAYIELKDIGNEIIHISDKVEADPERLTKVSERVNVLNSLLQKYKTNEIIELVKLKDKINHDLEKINFSDLDLKRIKEEISALRDELQHIGDEISKQRSSKLKGIQDTMSNLLNDLAMPNAVFKIDIQKRSDFNKFGMDEINYLFSANGPSNLQPISKVASGGEMSRFMLSLKYLLSSKMQLPTIIFDEIDSGVSGEVAHKMGEVFRNMANHMQIINITHLPQVAAKGDQHIKVYKTSHNSEIVTKLKTLNDKDRKDEIARMLSGEKVTEAALSNAEELLRK